MNFFNFLFPKKITPKVGEIYRLNSVRDNYYGIITKVDKNKVYSKHIYSHQFFPEFSNIEYYTIDSDAPYVAKVNDFMGIYTKYEGLLNYKGQTKTDIMNEMLSGGPIKKVDQPSEDS